MKLSLSLVPSALTTPLLDGEVTVEGIEFEGLRAASVDANSRAMLNLEFDVAEMSLATFLRARADGVPIIGLPVFTGRRFVQPGIGRAPGAAIASPADLADRRVGLPQYWMTSSVWHRATLFDEYGIDARAVRWVTVQSERFGDGTFADGVAVELCCGATLPELLKAGEIDAVLFPRPIETRFEPAAAVPVFDDAVAAQREAFTRTGRFPIMHFVVIREALIEAEPGLAGRLVGAFERAKALAIGETDRHDGLEPPIHGQGIAESLDLFGGDPWPYGLAANREVLRWLIDDAYRQSLIDRPLAAESLFVEVEP